MSGDGTRRGAAEGGSFPSLLVRVQHHPARARLLDRLLPSLEGLPVEVVTDPDPTGRPSAWRTYRRCLEPADADWTVIVQDDAVCADGFADTLPSLLADQPGTVVCLFVAGAPVRFAKAVVAAHQQGERWAEPARVEWLPTVATAWPAQAASDMLAWAAQTRVNPTSRGDDNIVGRWARESGQRVVACVPSVVQHPDDSPSTIGRKHGSGRNRFRVAACYTGVAYPCCHTRTAA